MAFGKDTDISCKEKAREAYVPCAVSRVKRGTVLNSNFVKNIAEGKVKWLSCLVASWWAGITWELSLRTLSSKWSTCPVDECVTQSVSWGWTTSWECWMIPGLSQSWLLSFCFQGKLNSEITNVRFIERTALLFQSLIL